MALRPPARYASRAGSRNASVVAAAPARTSTVPPTCLRCCPTPVGCPLPCAHTRGKWAPLRVGCCRLVAQPLSSPLQAGLRFLPPPLPAAPSVDLTTSLPRGEGYGLTTLRRWHARGLGSASTPVARHLRGLSSEQPTLATYLLVQACQHLGLVLCDDAGGGSPGLTVPRTPGPRPPWCWQSQRRLTPGLPSRRMRIRCPEASAPPRCQGRTPR